MSTLDDRDPFAFARLGESDAVLFALIAEYRRVDRARREIRHDLEKRGNERSHRQDVKVEIGRMIYGMGPRNRFTRKTRSI